MSLLSIRPFSTATTDRGAVAVEAALVIPLILIILLGIIDTALYLRDVAAVSAVVRHGARIASAEPRRDTMSDDAAASVARAASALPPGSVEELWVFQAGTDGMPLGGQLVCAQRCIRMTWDSATRQFRRVSGTWSSVEINACVGDPAAMSVGVFVKVRHTMLFSALLGGAGVRTIGDRAVMRFEPLPTRSCGLGVS